ncbi:hypothetical protein C943_02853 [Mariniradius saccharolyticus AK6]|uniref:DUF1232 domain-containing protein n=1 Tax=Mariniradius saccharolyticus AK6 TaxID=1239962 RepID=M7Y2I2_9BACT|nr:YkvA family protein [Mariniradius saccharolyticus]EMS34962.1 hypothetical protein C943_02853 [Mariniradius saccharolyticus AK6]
MENLDEKKEGFLDRAKMLYLKKAQEIAGEESKLRKLLKNVAEKLDRLAHHPKVQAVIEPVKIFKRMIQAHMNGSHKVSAKSLVLMVLGLVYFLSPIDVIPDFLPGLGFTDDLSVILAVFHAIKHEVDDFLAWEKQATK